MIILGIIEVILGLYLMLIGFITRSENTILLKFIPFLIGLLLIVLGLGDLGLIILNV